MSFKCTIPGVSLKVFGRAIQSLSKIGDELYFEPREDGLYLRSVNSSRSAYACFQFSPNFFNHYVDISSKEETKDEESFRCKIGMKSVMTVFRNLATMDKMVEKCRISLSAAEDRLVFQMYCRHGIIKTHKLAFIECETLQAVSSKDMCPNKITSLPKLLCDAVLNFQANQEEITLIVRPDFLALQNYVDEDQDLTKILRTELTLSPDEFDQYQVGVDTDITFCLKELRAVLAFADITNLPVTLQFESAGRPITFSITGDLSYEANFVLATLAESENSNAPASNSQAQSSKNAKSSRKHQSHSQITHQSRNVSKNSSGKSHQSRGQSEANEIYHGRIRPDQDNSSNNRMNEEDDEQSMMSAFHVEDPTIADASSLMQSSTRGRLEVDNNKSNTANKTKATLSNGNLAFNGRLHIGGNDSGSRFCEPKQKQTKVGYLHEQQDENEGSPIIPVQNQTDYSVMDEVEEVEDDGDEVPATPPSKKFRSVFFGTQSSTQPSQSQSKAEILAPNSDEDD